jgi:hypothetical protein
MNDATATASATSFDQAPPVRAVAAPNDPHAVTARRIFLGALTFNAALTVFWLVSMATDSRFFFPEYRMSWLGVANTLIGIAFFYVLWGFVWWGIKSLALRWVGFTKDERRDSFSTRIDRHYDVAALTAKYSERRIRIADMIGRRGRFALLAFAGLFGMYYQTLQDPGARANFAEAFTTQNLFEGVLGSWIFLGMFYVNGWLGATFYGPQSRVMDGYLGRANCLLITTLWTAFTFVMVPLGLKLAAIYPRDQFAVVFGLIWLSYITTDAFAEIFGSLFGKQRIKVWGVGDVNRKSVAGVVAGFLGALVVNLAVIGANGLLTPAWIGLAVTIALSNCLVELYSPRGTDDFTMATTNALLCLAFGAWIH